MCACITKNGIVRWAAAKNIAQHHHHLQQENILSENTTNAIAFVKVNLNLNKKLETKKAVTCTQRVK